MSFDRMTFKVVVVGDGAVGKTCMLVTYAQGTFPRTYIPTVFETYNKGIVHEGLQFHLGLYDTAGQEDFDKIRLLSYPETDVFILAYDISAPTSFDNVFEKWFPDLCENGHEQTPKILVGLKSDLREDPESRRHLEEMVVETDVLPYIEAEKGEELARRMKCFSFVECSALTGKNLSLVFERTIAQIVKIQKARARGPPPKKFLASISTSEDVEEDVRAFHM